MNLVLTIVATLVAGSLPQESTIPTNRTWERLPEPQGMDGQRRALEAAGRQMGAWGFDFTGVPVTGARLVRLATAAADASLLRAVRVDFQRPVDLDDFLYFVDDLLEAKRRRRSMPEVVIPPGRARSAGILLHPDDIFRDDRPRTYGADGDPMVIVAPASPRILRPAKNGAPLGPDWYLRYQQPETESERLDALSVLNPTFRVRLQSLIDQLRAQGAFVEVESTVRKPERGYLIYGCFILSKAKNARDVRSRVRRLVKFNRRWGINVPIRWMHPRGWRATVAAAHRMAEAYNVDFATAWGARKSDHYDGKAFDLIAVGLPEKLELLAPDGARRVFDLSGEAQSRDLNLSPEIIDWVEEHFVLEKLRKDYPHWGDRAEVDGGINASSQ